MTDAAPALTPIAAVRPLARNTSFLALMTGRFVSRAGDALISVASIWLVLDLTGGRPLSAAFAGVAQFVPAVFAGLLAVAFIDGWDRRRTMIINDVLRGLVVLAIPLLDYLGHLQVWHIYVQIFLVSAMLRLFDPARHAMLPELIDEKQTVRANAISEGTNQIAWVLGASAGGYLVATLGAAAAYYLDAASFFVSAVAMLFVRLPARPRANRRKRPWQDMVEGFVFVRRTPVLFAIVLSSFVSIISFAPVPQLMPVLVRNELDGTSRMVGWLLSCFFIGSVIGSTVLAKLGDQLHRGRSLLFGVTSLGVLALALALAPHPLVAAAVLALLGGANTAINVAEYSLLQSGSPAEKRGRVFALSNVSQQMLRPLALIIAGLIAEAANVRWALGILALAAIATGVVATAWSPLRHSK